MKMNEKIDDYTLLHECLPPGGFGRVFLAKKDDGKFVALKQVSLLSQAGERELQAIESYKKCPASDSLLKIYHIGKKDGYFYYTMELADNILGAKSKEYKPYTLASLLEESKVLTVTRTREIISQILEGLIVIHSQKLVHRDIKPANIIFVNGRAKLSDIGLLANDMSMTCQAGTKGFMPPADSPIEENSLAVDLYAMTRLIYCCLTGKPAKGFHYDCKGISSATAKEGPDLVRVMFLEDDELKNMSVQQFRDMLAVNDIPAPYMSYSNPEVCNNGSNVTAEEWLSKHEKDLLKSPAKTALRWGGMLVLFLLLVSGFAYLFIQQRENDEKPIIQSVQLDSGSEKNLAEAKDASPALTVVTEIPKTKKEAETDIKDNHSHPGTPIPEMPQIENSEIADFEERFAISSDVDLQTWFHKLSRFKRYSNEYSSVENYEKELLRDREMKVQELFRRTGMYSGKNLNDLLSREFFSGKSIENRLAILLEKYYGRDQARQLSLMSMGMQGRLIRKEQEELLKARQQYWRSQSGTADEIVGRMLKEDQVMQMAAVNMMLERFCREVIRTFEYSGKYDNIIPGLVRLQEEFIFPVSERK